MILRLPYAKLIMGLSYVPSTSDADEVLLPLKSTNDSKRMSTCSQIKSEPLLRVFTSCCCVISKPEGPIGSSARFDKFSERTGRHGVAICT